MNRGLGILVRSMSVPTSGFAYGNVWQYHPRSDRHSKILCWAILFDLLRRDSPIARHIRAGKASFGINHTMRDFQHDRKKDLDFVVCRRGPDRTYLTSRRNPITGFSDMVGAYDIHLDDDDRSDLRALPRIPLTGVQSALVAMEAKAAMTEFAKARPRLYDELNSSHLTIHGDTDSAVAAAFVLVNASTTFISPLRAPFHIDAARPAPVTKHKQPQAAVSVIEKIEQLPRRAQPGVPGFDAVGLATIACANDGTPVRLISGAPSPQIGDAFHYDSFIERIETIYAARFSGI